MLAFSIGKYPSLHCLLLLFIIFIPVIVSFQRCAKITPDSASTIPVELWKEFTAVCNVPAPYTAEDIEWFLNNRTVRPELYKKVNQTAMSVTLNVTEYSLKHLLKCNASKKTHSFEFPCVYGIYLEAGYPPLKPKNFTCIAFLSDKLQPATMTCSWDPGTRDPHIKTTYSLNAFVLSIEKYNNSSDEPLARSLTITFPGALPLHIEMEIELEVRNALNTVTVKQAIIDTGYVVKPNPPSNVKIIPEDNFPNSLMVNWTHPFHYTVFETKYNIRYCQAGSSVWTEVPQDATEAYIESFRLQSLQPYTQYVVQMRCIHKKGIGYWSDWSSNVTGYTPEATPESSPDLWRVYGESDSAVTLIWKDPEKSNGKILGYDIMVDGISNVKLVPSKMLQFHLKEKEAFVTMTANNSAGVSPPTSLLICRRGLTVPKGVEKVHYSTRDGQIWVDWLPRFPSRASEYLVEWVSIPDKVRDWQRVPGNVNSTVLKGNFELFTRYNINVHPIYRIKWNNLTCSLPGEDASVSAYLQQGTPLKGPSVDVTETQKNSAQLKWEEIPITSQRGFLTNYTIFYKTGDVEHSVVVPPDTYSYKLTGLASESQYVVHIMASNIEGSVNGTDSSLYTKKYDDGEIEVIVVLVCLGFLFIFVFIMMFTLKNREVIKKHLWPQVPDPSHSTIATWSPDCPIKADSPKESTLPDVSVVEVDVFDRKSLCEEDKSMLPLKKDKYFSEEHSSGIGGSSCMSSPRQSVSDSDEGDSGQTTASTVQYSSVVASGYKGQTPSLQAPVFARSESTQPLLDCEEHPEHLLDSSSHQKNSYFKRGGDLQQLQPQEWEEPSVFSPMEEEDTPTLTEDPPGPAPGYMPQQSGYRPQ
ncbi:interleukin-6 receptor subunit beta isoform X2 [Hoplias malabaricus]